MSSKWRKAKNALTLHLCTSEPPTDDDNGGAVMARDSDSSVSSMASTDIGAIRFSHSGPLTPSRSHSPLAFIRTGSRTSRKTCAICLDAMKPGHGHALFTAECSHTFHFACIASNVKHGNKVCPVCRAKWKEVPLQGIHSEPLRCRARISPLNWPQQQDGWTTILPRLPPARPPHPEAARRATEPAVFADDEPLEHRSSGENGSGGENGNEPTLVEVEIAAGNSQATDSRGELAQGSGGLQGREIDSTSVQLEMFPEFSAIPCSEFREKFSVLVHLKAPCSSAKQQQSPRTWNTGNPSQILDMPRDRAPIDLVTVLDVSGSMAGTKLALLKRAMGFVIHNLGPMDRLSVIAFSSTARRLFPLRRMSEGGRQFALQAVNGLVSTGGTNIAEGLKKGAKVLEDRREQNPVCSIILLSDGQDTYNVGNRRQVSILSNSRRVLDYQSLLPGSIRQPAEQGNIQIPVHTFGFGTDHDSASMHSISETSGGTFSFIETESIIQDAFAQCIGGLLSVVIQDMQVTVTCASSGVQLNAIQAGSYVGNILDDGQKGLVKIGDLYAEEERDFLVHVKLPQFRKPEESTTINEMKMLKVICSYRDPVSQETIQTPVTELSIQRPEYVSSNEKAVCLEVDRQRNRLCTAESIAEARALADRGDLTGAQLVLGIRRRALQASQAAQAGDQLCSSLEAELKQIQDGGIEEFTEAIKVGELMVENPHQFVCNFSQLQAGCRVTALRAEEDLALGGVYLLLPMKKYLRCVLSPSDMASINLLALQCNSRGKKLPCNTRIFLADGSGNLSGFSSLNGGAGRSEDLQVEVADRFVVTKLEIDEDENQPMGLGFGLSQHRIRCFRDWKPALETIKESPRVCKSWSIRFNLNLG